MNYILIFVGGKVRADKNGGYGESDDDGGGSRRSIEDQRNNMTMFMIHGKLTASRAELADEKAASNMGRGRGSGPSHPLQEGWVGQVEASR